MTSILDKIKNKLGMTNAQADSKGHVLGTRESNTMTPLPRPEVTQEKEEPKVIEVCFEEQTMGMQVESAKDGLPRITKVFEGSIAARKGVCIGDLIIAIDNLEISSYDQCMELLQNSVRPLNLRYYYHYLCGPHRRRFD
jgi:hypothetical protein